MRKQIQRFIEWCLVIGIVFGYPAWTYALDIHQISVQGNTFIPTHTLLSTIDSKVGLPYNPRVVAEDIQKIYNLGFFSSVEVDLETENEGAHLRFIVEEFPFISRIEFEGNQKLKEEKLEGVLSLPPSDLSDLLKLKFYPVKIQEDVVNLTQLYHKEGFSDVRITSTLVPDPEDSQGKMILRYQIEENERVAVREVTFEGNTAFSDQELSKVMQIKKKNFWSFFTGTGKYEKYTFEDDLEKLKNFYADHGYLEAQVVDYTLDFKDTAKNLYITIVLDEGAIYTIRELTISGNTVYTTEELQKEIKSAPDDPFSRSKIRNDIFSIADLYAQKGYIRPISENTAGKLQIDPDIQVDEQNKLVNVTYAIREGEPHTVNRITIVGNKMTRDKVIRRELKLQEGDVFNSEALRQSQQRVFNLGLFDELQVDVTDGPEPTTIDLAFEVKERYAIGSFNFGGGWDTVDNWTLTGGVTSENIFGLAHSLEFSATLGSTLTLFNIDYYMPRVFDSSYSVGISAYNQQKEYTNYDSRKTGGGFRFGRRITENIYTSAKYRYERVKISNLTEDASTLIQEAEGLSETSAVSLLLRRSTINNVLLPTKGMRTELRGEIAGGVLGADNNFYMISLNNNIYFPLFKDVALRLKGEYAYVKEYGDSEKVPIFERFFGGGAWTIRGYEERSVGPKDENGDPIGGNTRVVLTSEIIFPVSKEIRLLTFFDAGDVYGADEDIDPSTFRKGVGVGVRVSTPLGLFRLDWGYKLDRETGESRDEFHFGIGNLF